MRPKVSQQDRESCGERPYHASSAIPQASLRRSQWFDVLKPATEEKAKTLNCEQLGVPFTVCQSDSESEFEGCDVYWGDINEQPMKSKMMYIREYYQNSAGGLPFHTTPAGTACSVGQRIDLLSVVSSASLFGKRIALALASFRVW